MTAIIITICLDLDYHGTVAARTRLKLCVITNQNSLTKCLRKPAQCDPALLYLRGSDATLLSQPQVLLVICVQFLNKCMTSKAIKSGIIFTKYKSGV